MCAAEATLLRHMQDSHAGLSRIDLDRLATFRQWSLSLKLSVDKHKAFRVSGEGGMPLWFGSQKHARVTGGCQTS